MILDVVLLAPHNPQGPLNDLPSVQFCSLSTVQSTLYIRERTVGWIRGCEIRGYGVPAELPILCNDLSICGWVLEPIRHGYGGTTVLLVCGAYSQMGKIHEHPGN